MATEKQMQQAQLDKLTAEVAKLIEETRKTAEDVRKSKFEARKLWIEGLLYPFIAAATVMGATAAVVKVFF